MEWLEAPEYWLARLIFQRGLGVVYLLAFVAALNQFRPLLGERGLLPVPGFLARSSPRRSPSVFHIHYSDRFAAVVAWMGIGLSLLVVSGVADSGPMWRSMAVWLALWVLYLSIVNVGQTFYGFGWESLLLETGLFAVFLGPSGTVPPLLMIWLLRWLLFRVEFGAGLIKIRGDRCWRDLTCLEFHHETQPMPNPLSRYFHRLPRPLHRVEVLANHFTQLVVPFLLFTPQPVAAVAGGTIAVTQSWLMLSGNFSWLNAVTIVLAFSAFSTGVLDPLVPADPPELSAMPSWHHGAVIGITVIVTLLSYWPIRNLVGRRQRMNFSFNPLHFVNAYGAFGSITRERFEVIVEGTRDPEPRSRTRWEEYEFKGKPGDPMRRPPQVAPYHLRLDWLMWFAALSPRYARGWFVPLAQRLLEGDPATLKLLRHNPFPDTPPVLVRAHLYRYRFSTTEERRATGAWWVRNPAGEYLAPVRLRQGEVVRAGDVEGPP